MKNNTAELRRERRERNIENMRRVELYKEREQLMKRRENLLNMLFMTEKAAGRYWSVQNQLERVCERITELENIVIEVSKINNTQTYSIEIEAYTLEEYNKAKVFKEYFCEPGYFDLLPAWDFEGYEEELEELSEEEREEIGKENEELLIEAYIEEYKERNDFETYKVIYWL